jgi:hypothetical protein
MASGMTGTGLLMRASSGWAVRVRRVQHAVEITQRSVEQVAARVGFGSATAFGDWFKRTTGDRPECLSADVRLSGHSTFAMAQLRLNIRTADSKYSS